MRCCCRLQRVASLESDPRAGSRLRTAAASERLRDARRDADARRGTPRSIGSAASAEAGPRGDRAAGALAGHAGGGRGGRVRCGPAPRHRDRRLPAGAGRRPAAARGGRRSRGLARDGGTASPSRPSRRCWPRARGSRTCWPRWGRASGRAATRSATRCARRSARRARRLFRPGPRGRAASRPAGGQRAAAAAQRACAPRRSLASLECTRCRADLYHSYRRDGKARRADDQLRWLRRRSGLDGRAAV